MEQTTGDQRHNDPAPQPVDVELKGVEGRDETWADVAFTDPAFSLKGLGYE